MLVAASREAGLLILAVLSTALAHGDTIRLRGGEVVIGRIVKDERTKVVIESKTLGPSRDFTREDRADRAGCGARGASHGPAARRDVCSACARGCAGPDAAVADEHDRRRSTAPMRRLGTGGSGSGSCQPTT
jgi:hypothetical protein